MGRNHSPTCLFEYQIGFNPRPPPKGRDAPGQGSGVCPHRFNPRAPPKGRDDCPLHETACALKVSIHAPPKGRDSAAGMCPPSFGACFNPRAPEGARRSLWYPEIACFNPKGRDSSCQDGQGDGFQSTRPRRGATRLDAEHTGDNPCFNPRPPKGRDKARLINVSRVSIHAPPKGRDWQIVIPPGLPCFNPRAPECDYIEHHLSADTNRFQSTRPRRGATRLQRTTVYGCFNPPPPKGRDLGWTINRLFQSTRPRRGATGIELKLRHCPRPPALSRFQSTRPRRGATWVRTMSARATEAVSIHAPPKGRDERCKTAAIEAMGPGFNPRAPEGARLYLYIGSSESRRFQSTRPRRGATNWDSKQYLPRRCFNPRAPEGARHQSLL